MGRSERRQQCLLVVSRLNELLEHGRVDRGRAVAVDANGVLCEIELEFFELVCSVDGVGVKKALRAMVRPVKEVATAIEEQDAKCLASLPGIGPAMAERIIAKLRRKAPKFALMAVRDEKHEADVEPDVVSETFEILRSLGHNESEARRLLDAALGSKKKFKDVQGLIEAIYQQSQR